MEDTRAPSVRRLTLAYIDEERQVFEAMLGSWSNQQLSRGLEPSTVYQRDLMLKRFRDFTSSYPWTWLPGDMEEYSSSLFSRERPLSRSTIRSYQVAIKSFCDHLLDARYGWVAECRTRFGETPSQICFAWNTVAHVSEYEGQPGRRPLSRAELQALFDVADDRFDRIRDRGAKGALAALRDSQLIKTAYAWGLRRREVLGLDLADLHSSPHAPQWHGYAILHVRWGKASAGGPPRRRSVHALPEFSWAVDGLRSWVEDARERFSPGANTALWPNERGMRVGARYIDSRFAQLREEAGLPKELTMHCLRHSYITDSTEHGYAQRFLSDQAGHSYASSTQIYTAVSDDFKDWQLRRALSRYEGESN